MGNYEFSVVGFSGSQTDCKVRVEVKKGGMTARTSFYYCHTEGEEDHFHFYGECSCQLIAELKEWFAKERPNRNFCARFQKICPYASDHKVEQCAACKDKQTPLRVLGF